MREGHFAYSWARREDHFQLFSTYPLRTFSARSLSASLRAVASSAKFLIVCWPLLPIRPYWVCRFGPSTHTIQNLLEPPSTNSKCRFLPLPPPGAGAGDGATAAGGGVLGLAA